MDAPLPVVGMSNLVIVALNIFLDDEHKIKPPAGWAAQQDDYLSQMVGPRLVNPGLAFALGIALVAIPAYASQYGAPLKDLIGGWLGGLKKDAKKAADKATAEAKTAFDKMAEERKAAEAKKP